MDCDEVLTRAAELAGVADSEVETHLQNCAQCRDAIRAAREGREALAAFESADAPRALPRADADAAWRAVHVRVSMRWVWTLARAAVVLLAVTGALALVGVDPRPWRASAAASFSHADLAASVETALAPLIARLDDRDRIQADRLRDAAIWLDDRRRGDFESLRAEMVLLRDELASARTEQSDVAQAEMPSLPDAH